MVLLLGVQSYEGFRFENVNLLFKLNIWMELIDRV